MKKITELTEPKYRTVHFKDSYGNRVRDTEEYEGFRPVESVGGGARFLHYIIDYILFGLATVPFSIAHAMILLEFEEGTPLHAIISLMGSLLFIVLYSALYTFFEGIWQKTPGKFLTKTIVINEYGEKPGIGSIVLRSIIRLVPFEAFSCLSDNHGSRGWHDKWSKTWTVTNKELAILKQLQQEQNGDGHWQNTESTPLLP